MSIFVLVSLSSPQTPTPPICPCEMDKKTCVNFRKVNLFFLPAESSIQHPGKNGVAVLNVTDYKKLQDTGLETCKQLTV